ncbi:MAG TPA: LLM class flavin-dependent oxidoreductase, partial [Gemmatimonadales bacterium]|nr:LLM class flavin-dependent oxidoreductase [Gemmatimonadales bacterium]
SPAAVIRDVVEQAVLADRLGVHFFGVGEHHRPDFAISAPEVVLAAIAGRTERIRLGSAVTVLSSDDPVRVFERFSTLDAVSNGRAEIIVGRGSFTESFPLFGLDLDQYDLLFEERLDLLVKLLGQGPVSWRGRTRAPLDGVEVHPRVESGRLLTWVGVGGSPQSVVRTARHGLGLMLAIIGGNPERFRTYVSLYRHTLNELGHPDLPVGMHSPGYVADSDERAREEFWPPFREMMTRIGAERGWPPMSRAQFDQEVEHGSLYVGSPETVARRIAESIQALDVSRFDLKYSAGTLAHDRLMRCIELYGSEVMPKVRELLQSDVG